MMYILAAGVDLTLDKIKDFAYKGFYDFQRKYSIDLYIDFKTDLTGIINSISEKGIPVIFFLSDNLSNKESAVFLLKNLIQKHEKNELNLLGIDLFYPLCVDSSKSEILYNIWWDFHEKYLNKIELSKKLFN